MLNGKRDFRELVTGLKKNYTSSQLACFSEKIAEFVENLPVFQSSHRIALYHALPDEVQTVGLLERWHKSKQVFLPVVLGNELVMCPYTGESELQPGSFGIMEPQGELPPEEPSSLDLLIVPGVAFDRDKNRLGRGKGFYDRLLADLDVPTIGLCFDFQLFTQIPTDAHDRRMSYIITESGVID
jgi:5-formyltetrahydrofolate cyclo-ligase